MLSSKLLVSFLAIVSIRKSIAQVSRFPNDFKFGSGSSSYQVEGAWNVDGKGEHIWDRLTRDGDVAADSYHRYKEDVQLLKNAGMDFYRFSVSWSRILPNGDDSLLNEPGLAYYDRLIDELLANGIEPRITIFHFDLPQPLEDIGGMLNPDIVEHLTRFAEILFRRYGDRVRTWYTFNEPRIFCHLIYASMRNVTYWSDGGNYRCGYHALLANAHIYDLYQAKYKRPGARVGLTYNCGFRYPKDATNATHVTAAARAMQFDCGLYMHPIFSRDGGFPPMVVDAVDRLSRNEGRTRSRLPALSGADKRLIRGKSDFVGHIYYTSRLVEPAAIDAVSQYDAKPMPTESNDDSQVIKSVDPMWPISRVAYEHMVPEGLRAALNWMRREYDSPEIEIAENGWPDEGELNDVQRIAFLQGHLNATLEAINDGCKVRAHTTWSLMDNYEWLNGYRVRYGLYHVNFDVSEKTRTAKASVNFLKTVIKTRMVPK